MFNICILSTKAKSVICSNDCLYIHAIYTSFRPKTMMSQCMYPFESGSYNIPRIYQHEIRMSASHLTSFLIYRRVSQIYVLFMTQISSETLRKIEAHGNNGHLDTLISCQKGSNLHFNSPINK